MFSRPKMYSKCHKICIIRPIPYDMNETYLRHSHSKNVDASDSAALAKNVLHYHKKYRMRFSISYFFAFACILHILWPFVFINHYYR